MEGNAVVPATSLNSAAAPTRKALSVVIIQSIYSQCLPLWIASREIKTTSETYLEYATLS